MSKELTEQWRNGTLEQKYYYVKYFGNGQKPFVEIELKNFLLDLVNVKDRDNVEVLAPVPSHSEYQSLKDNCEFTHTRLKGTHRKIAQLEKKLEIATKALKFYTLQDAYVSCFGNPVNPNPMVARQALKEIDLVGTSTKGE